MFAIGGSSPGAAKTLDQYCVLSFDLHIDVLHLIANLYHAWEIRPMLDAKLSLLLLKIAAAIAKLKCSLVATPIPTTKSTSRI